MIVEVKYAGRVYEYVSYRAEVRLPGHTTFSEIEAALRKCRDALASAHQGIILEPDARVYSHNNLLIVEVEGQLKEET